MEAQKVQKSIFDVLHPRYRVPNVQMELERLLKSHYTLTAVTLTWLRESRWL